MLTVSEKAEFTLGGAAPHALPGLGSQRVGPRPSSSSWPPGSAFQNRRAGTELAAEALLSSRFSSYLPALGFCPRVTVASRGRSDVSFGAGPS